MLTFACFSLTFTVTVTVTVTVTQTITIATIQFGIVRGPCALRVFGIASLSRALVLLPPSVLPAGDVLRRELSTQHYNKKFSI